MAEWWGRGRLIAADGEPRVMGILNVTPDSFSDGGRFLELEPAVEHALRLLDEGAEILDIGGESSRPGAIPVSLDEERRRVLPVLEALAKVRSVCISIDTAKPDLAREALRLGASIINDIGGLRQAEMRNVAVESDTGVVVMHMAGSPLTMQENPHYDDVVTEVYDELARRVDQAESVGIERRRIAVDPGIGFGKTAEHNLELMRNLDQFKRLGCVVLVGTSRKRFLGALTNRPLSERLTGSIVTSLAALTRGASVVRVHDVAPMVDAITLWRALVGWGGGK